MNNLKEKLKKSREGLLKGLIPESIKAHDKDKQHLANVALEIIKKLHEDNIKSHETQILKAVLDMLEEAQPENYGGIDGVLNSLEELKRSLEEVIEG